MDAIRIGTRGSGLAMLQARLAAGKFHELGWKTRIVVIKTTGDIEKDKPLYDLGQKGIFVKELEAALEQGKIDAAVHSLKDMPVEMKAGLVLAALLPRENPLDAFVSAKYGNLSEVPKGGKVAAGSIRRMSQVRAAASGLLVLPIRGNVDTRLKKIIDNFDGGIMAAAGLIRMKLDKGGLNLLPAGEFTPPPGQGIIAVEAVKGSAAAIAAAKFSSDASVKCYAAERDFFLETGGGCSLPVAALCVEAPKGYVLYGYIGDEEGKRVYRGVVEFGVYDRPYGRDLAKELLKQGGRQVLDYIRKKNSNNQQQ